MGKALTAARAELGEHAPRIEMFKIPTDKIREVIGTGGKVIREIVEKTGAKINIEDDGSVKVASANADSIKAAATGRATYDPGRSEPLEFWTAWCTSASSRRGA
jgi:polyribonucleotide nucleotidyltransferase